MVDTAGAAQADVGVEVRRQPSFAEGGNAAAALFFTAGLACLAGACDVDDRVIQTATDGNGAFRATLPRAHLPGFETDTDWFVSASKPAPEGLTVGASSGDEFEVADPVQRPPDLPLWLTPPEVDVTGTGVSTTWVPIDRDEFVDDEVGYSVAFLDEVGGAVWSVDRARPGNRLDPRVLEDTRGTVLLAARGDVRAGNTTYHRTIAAPQPSYTGPAGTPPSRGAGCALADAAPVPCWLTDGNLVAPGDATVPVSEVTIHVPETRPNLLVARGCGGCDIELSADGAVWQPVELDPRTGLALVSAPSPVRQIRVRREVGDLQQASEVSLWPAPPFPTRPSGQGILPYPSERSSSDWAVIVLAFALTLVIGGAAWAMAKRRRAATAPSP